MKDKGFNIDRRGTDVRIKAVGRTEAEALSRLIEGLAACQSSDAEAAVGGDKDIKLGYSKKGYLPADLINDILGLQAVSGEVYPGVADLSLGDGILKARLTGAKVRLSTNLKEALYLNSVFKKCDDGFSVEVDVIS